MTTVKIHEDSFQHVFKIVALTVNNLLSSSARIGRRFSVLKGLPEVDSLFFLLLEFAAELTAEKRTTDCPPAGKVQVNVAKEPPCCLAARYSAMPHEEHDKTKGKQFLG